MESRERTVQTWTGCLHLHHRFRSFVDDAERFEREQALSMIKEVKSAGKEKKVLSERSVRHERLYHSF